MSDNILNFILFPGGIFAILFGLILLSFERITVARLQGRYGPPIYQNIIDILKLFNKEILIPKTASKSIFLISPILGLVGMLVAVYILPISGFYNGSNFNSDMIVLIYLMVLPAFSYIISGSSSSSVYSAVSVSRIIILTFGYELTFFIVLLTISLSAGEGNIVFSLKDIMKYQQLHSSFIFDWKLIPLFVAFIIFILATLEIPPFHIAENSGDIMEGYLMEYSGKLLGFFEINHALKLLVIIILTQLLFMSGFDSGSFILNFICFLGKSVFILLFLAFIHAVMPSFRIDQAFRFLITVPLVLSLISLGLVLLSTKGLI